MQLIGQNLLSKAPLEIHDGVKGKGAANEGGHDGKVVRW